MNVQSILIFICSATAVSISISSASEPLSTTVKHNTTYRELFSKFEYALYERRGDVAHNYLMAIEPFLDDFEQHLRYRFSFILLYISKFEYSKAQGEIRALIEKYNNGEVAKNRQNKMLYLRIQFWHCWINIRFSDWVSASAIAKDMLNVLNEPICPVSFDEVLIRELQIAIMHQDKDIGYLTELMSPIEIIPRTVVIS